MSEKLALSEKEAEAMVWCFENDVNVLQLASGENTITGIVAVVEYSIMNVTLNRKTWGKMALDVFPGSIMQDVKDAVLQVRACYYASKQQ